MPVNQFRHVKMRGEMLQKAMDDLAMTEDEFMFLTGANRKTLRRWLEAETEEERAPHWTRVLMAVLGDPEKRKHAQMVALKHSMSEDDYRRVRDGGSPLRRTHPHPPFVLTE